MLFALTEPLAQLSTLWTKIAAAVDKIDPERREPDLVDDALDQLRAWMAVGAGEQGGNNRGKWVKDWAQRPKANWCAAVLVSALESAASKQGIQLPFPTDGSNRLGAKRFARNVGKAGSFVDLKEGLILPGDILCYHRGPRGSWKGHVRMAESYDPHSRIITYIAGNEGDFPSRIRRRPIKRDRDDLVMIARL